MPTPAQLQAESYWGREIVTDEIDWLGDELCRRTNRPRVAFGSKGNTGHLRGAHRSQEWIKRSRYCTNRTYTVQSGLTADQERHVAGVDFTPGDWGTARNRALMVEQTGRLLAAMKAGQLDEVVELFGTTNGRTVTGYNNRTNQAASSDSSHLDHWHLTIDRRHCRHRQLMERILAIALGLDVEEDDMTPEELRDKDIFPNGYGDAKTNPTIAFGTFVRNVGRDTEATRTAVANLSPMVDQLAARPAVTVDYDQLADALLRRVLNTGSQG